MFFSEDASNYKIVHLYGGPMDGKNIPVEIDGCSMMITIAVNTPEDIEDGFGNPNEPQRTENLTYQPHTPEDALNDIWRLVEPTIKGTAHEQ